VVTFPDTCAREAWEEDSERANLFEVGDFVAGLYEIRSVLGSGGMAQVFEAHDHALDRRVAIKAGWPGIPPGALHQEARALAAIRHEALPTVHGIGVHRKTDFIVMERIYGVSLEDHLRQRQQRGESFAVDEVLWLARKIAEGLAVVHMAGIAHRDVKPSNVMLTADRRVVLMDFGLMLPEVAMQHQEEIAGSPAYMAPEAIDNDLTPGAGKLLDVYGLGATVFELLTGQLPFDAPTLDEIRTQQSKGAADIRTVRPDVGEELALLVAGMLAPRPEDRPESAETLVWQLRDLLNRKPTAPKGPLRVLVVDDDPTIAKLVEMLVRSSVDRAEVRTVNDGETALKLLREDPPDAMFLDVHMPHVNGVEVCMYVRGSGIAPRMAIFAMSAGAQDDDRQLLFHLGVREFIPKGREMRAQITQALSRAFPGRLKQPAR
jgi:serine/threonine-protein kinase